MAILAYSELLKRISGVEEKKVELFYQLIAKYNITSLRYNAFKKLAELEPSTIGNILQSLDVNKSGGCYLTVKKFFLKMQEVDILEVRKIGNRTYWKFKDEARDLALYLKF